MEVVGISLKSRPSNGSARENSSNGVLSDNEEEILSRSRTGVCRANRERNHHVFSPQSRSAVYLPTATAPKRGMIRLTALRGELENPRMYFSGPPKVTSASSTGRLERMRRTALRNHSPQRRVCGVSYTPESLQSFGRQLTMTELHKTVDSLIVDSVKKYDAGLNLPHIQQLDREITRISDTTDRHLLFRDDSHPQQRR